MTKNDIVNAVHAKLASNGDVASKRMVGDAVTFAVECMKDSIVNEGRLSYPQFGVFKTAQRKERQGRNPQTGESLTIPASTTVKFKPAPSFKRAL